MKNYFCSAISDHTVCELNSNLLNTFRVLDYQFFTRVSLATKTAGSILSDYVMNTLRNTRGFTNMKLSIKLSPSSGYYHNLHSHRRKTKLLQHLMCNWHANRRPNRFCHLDSLRLFSFIVIVTVQGIQ